MHCTNFRGAPVVPELERELGIPVIDSVVVGLWGALRIVGVPVPHAGFGSLARSDTAANAAAPSPAMAFR